MPRNYWKEVRRAVRITDEMLFQNAEQARELWLSGLREAEEDPRPACSLRFEKRMDRLLWPKPGRALLKTRAEALQRIAAVLAVVLMASYSLVSTLTEIRKANEKKEPETEPGWVEYENELRDGEAPCFRAVESEGRESLCCAPR